MKTEKEIVEGQVRWGRYQNSGRSGMSTERRSGKELKDEFDESMGFASLPSQPGG